MSLDAREKRVLNPRPLRHYRRTYSVGEVRAGLGVLVALGLLAAWVAWKGANPDPRLYGDPAAMPAQGTGATEALRNSPYAAGKPAAAPLPAARGPLPDSLGGEGWKEGTVSRFEAGNLYEKINGRADFFVSRGFQSLTFLPLTSAAGATIDLELYDLGSAENALSAFSGEKPDDVKALSESGSTWYLARNALFLARGKHYARIVGSDESAPVVGQLEAMRLALAKALPAGERPWAHALFEDALSIPSAKVTFQAENAFSFGFARNVYSGVLPDGETELFVAPAASPEAARSLAGEFTSGFLSYGQETRRGGAVWVKDRYLSTFATARPVSSMVVGIRGASKIEAAEEALERLEKSVSILPPDVLRRAGEGATAIGGSADAAPPNPAKTAGEAGYE